MQQSWRTDPDKLTFIACQPLPPHASGPNTPIIAREDDPWDQMVGDINLFLTPADEDPEGCIGEIELMIAPKEHRRKGFGRATLLTFLMYLQRHLDGILAEYGASLKREAEGDDAEGKKKECKMRLLQLRVKIGSKNEKSINLFKSVGFVKVGEGENYFGEVEMVFEGFLEKGRVEEQLWRWCIMDYEEMRYSRPSNW
jgi:RimJ/RimL family protein N-acetyltransferase